MFPVLLPLKHIYAEKKSSILFPQGTIQFCVIILACIGMFFKEYANLNSYIIFPSIIYSAVVAYILCTRLDMNTYNDVHAGRYVYNMIHITYVIHHYMCSTKNKSTQ